MKRVNYECVISGAGMCESLCMKEGEMRGREKKFNSTLQPPKNGTHSKLSLEELYSIQKLDTISYTLHHRMKTRAT